MPTGRILTNDQDQCCNSESLANEPIPERPIAENSNQSKRINIEPLNYGYIVTVGCQKFAIESSEKLVLNLAEYLKDPNGVERKWFEGKFLK